MDAFLEKACCVPRTLGVLVFDRSWVVIGSRGSLTEDDALELEKLLSWTKDGSTGQIAWGDSGDRCIQFHRAPNHTLVLMKVLDIPVVSKMTLSSPTASSMSTMRARV